MSGRERGIRKMDRFVFGNSGVCGKPARHNKPAHHNGWRVFGGLRQKVVRNPNSTLRPGAGAISRRIELA